MTNNHGRPVRAWRWLAALMLPAAVLTLTTGPSGALPAGSNESGEAAGVGTEVLNAEAPPGLPLCLEVADDSYYTVTAVGTVTANNSLVRYAGELEIILDPTEPYWISPLGAFNDANCTNPADEIPATITVTSPGGEVTNCGSNAATYTRVGTAVRFHGHGDCAVNGNVPLFNGSGTAGANTSHEFVGDLIPCSPIPGDDPVTCGPAQIQGDYTEL